jgi:hypothetical protein
MPAKATLATNGATKIITRLIITHHLLAFRKRTLYLWNQTLPKGVPSAVNFSAADRLSPVRTGIRNPASSAFEHLL